MDPIVRAALGSLPEVVDELQLLFVPAAGHCDQQKPQRVNRFRQEELTFHGTARRPAGSLLMQQAFNSVLLETSTREIGASQDTTAAQAVRR